ncbi:MAG: NAD-dependent deacylase [Chloroflexota bacterium]|nr:NAD-dependent deacylase [Chloroflexota bacterium]
MCAQSAGQSETDIAIDQAARMLHEAQYVVAFTGAGISTPSGIPDFRSASSGLWENVDPMAVASIFGFRANPKAFFDWVYPLAQLTLQAEPNPAHVALVRLERAGKLKGVITQNIDMLHQRSGIQTLYELHGHFDEATCTHCFTTYAGRPILERFIADHQVPRCPQCRGVLKPNVILFGEQLPVQVLRAAQEMARKADLMLIIGSSLEVAPASDIPLLAKRRGAKLIMINREATSVDHEASVIIHGDAALVLPEIIRCLETLP